VKNFRVFTYFGWGLALPALSLNCVYGCTILFLGSKEPFNTLNNMLSLMNYLYNIIITSKLPILICLILNFLDAGNAVSAKITTAGIGVVKSNPKDRKTLRNRK